MLYFPSELIKKKRDGGAHSPSEIEFMVSGHSSGSIPDYQMSAWLMAVFLRGMRDDETAALTEAMRTSGRTLDFSDLPSPAVDKHSTGGVGDKTTMILAPIAAAAGVTVPMIAGRGLGHTGGTLDKLEAIPGFRTRLSLEEFDAHVRERGICIVGQTEDICPADKRIYALRDVTATVESLPLICASIMSKKLAEGCAALVLDVKHGSGAFMKTPEAAGLLADRLMAIARAHGVAVSAYLTTVHEPLGRFVGNALEIGECLAILRQGSYLSRPYTDFTDTQELSLRLAGDMIWHGRKARDRDDGYAIAKLLLTSGQAAKKFEELCAAQGGDLTRLPQPGARHECVASSVGYIAAFDCERIGLAAIALGAGRLKASDEVDPAAGLEFHKKLGDLVQIGEPICSIYCDNLARAEQASAMIAQAVTISLQMPKLASLITSWKAG